MKGYLQRLVQTVTSPAASVNPWTASVFDVGYQGDFHDVPSGEFAPPAAAMQSHETTSPDSAQSSQASAPAQTLLPVAERNSLISELRMTQIALAPTQADHSAHRGPSFSQRIIPDPLVADAERSTQDSAEAKEPEMVRAKASQRASVPRSYDPLVSAEPGFKSGKAAVEVTVGSLRASADKKDARVAHNPPAGVRQRDEIQIHIGRIEVTAVHPSPPRAPKARDKEISLDAYLKRRDGRAG
jgi:hypothetical protein